jgi:serine/threonine protein kinase
MTRRHRNELIMKKFSDGTVLNKRYKIIKSLGEGAFGVVYMADDTLNPGVRRAIKEFARENIPKGKEELILRENRFLTNLSHPGLPRVTDQFFFEQNYYMVMDYIEGDSLDSLFIMEGEPYDEKRILPWFNQLCDIIDYLHSQDPPIIYRDLKPSNIIITIADEVKLIDFGTARFFNPEKMKDTFIMGTPGFAAPEQYGTDQSDARSDIYAMGATFYFLLTRRNMESSKFNFPPARSLNPRISPEMEALLTRCMAINPKDRFSSVKEIKNTLREHFREFLNAGSSIRETDESRAMEVSGSTPAKGLWLLYFFVLSVLVFLGTVIFNPEQIIVKTILLAAMIGMVTINIILSLIMLMKMKQDGGSGEGRIPSMVAWGSVILAIIYGLYHFLLVKSQ